MKSSSLSSSLFEHLKKPAAETLAEVLIALVVLSLGIAAAMTVVIMSVSANTEAEERLVAYNLAREGVEAIRSVRDTNWLRFPADRSSCWNVLPDIIDPADCSHGGSRLGDHDYYIVSRNVNDASLLYAWELDYPHDEDEDVILHKAQISPDEIIYLHEYASWCDDYCVDGEPSKYSRVIDVTIEDVDSMLITATVSWESHGEERSVVFTDQITNY